MDFGELLHAAKRNEHSAVKKEVKCYKTTFAPPKKDERSGSSLSANIQKFLARKEAEEKKKLDEAKRKRDDLLALRSQDNKAKKRVSAMLKRTKAYNKSAIEDAVDNENTAVTLGGMCQPDEDDYGYVSQEASAFYEKLMEKYISTPSDEPKFSKKSLLKSSAADLNDTKARVRMALLKEEEEEMMPHKRKRKTKEEKLRESEGGDKNQNPPDEREYEEEEPEIPVKQSKPRRPPPPPPMDFRELLLIAEKKQFEPIKFEPKVKDDDDDRRPMTKKQRIEFEKERDWRLRKEGKLPPLSASKPAPIHDQKNKSQKGSRPSADQRNNTQNSSERDRRDNRPPDMSRDKMNNRPSTDGYREKMNNRPSVDGNRERANNRSSMDGYREQNNGRPSLDGYRERANSRPSVDGYREQNSGRSSVDEYREQANSRPSDGYREQNSGRSSIDGYRERTNSRPSVDGYREQNSGRSSIDGYRERANSRPSVDGYREQNNSRSSTDEYREQANSRPSGYGNKDQRTGRPSDANRDQRNIRPSDDYRDQKFGRSEDGNSSIPRIPKANSNNRIERDERSQNRIPRLNDRSSNISNKDGKERKREDMIGKSTVKNNPTPSSSASRNSIEQRKGTSSSNSSSMSSNSKNNNLSGYSKKLQESLLSKLQEKERSNSPQSSEGRFRVPDTPPSKFQKGPSGDANRGLKPQRITDSRDLMRKESSMGKNPGRPVSTPQRTNETTRVPPNSKSQEALMRTKFGQNLRDMKDKKPPQMTSKDVRPQQSRQFPPPGVKRPLPSDVKSRQFPPSDVKPRQFPPPDVKPRQFPPPDVRSRQFPPADVRRKPKPVQKRRIEDSDEEYDSELDDFIDDGPEEEEDYSRHIKEIFGYDKSRYRDVDDGDECMESSFSQQLKEEFVSTKMGILEDLEDMEMEKREVAAAKKKKVMMTKRRRL